MTSTQTIGDSRQLSIESVYHQAEVGAGIQLSPNGVRVLARLGLGEALGDFCTEPDFHKYSVWDSGETILRTVLMPRVRETYGHAYYHAYRSDLIDVLVGADGIHSLVREHLFNPGPPRASGYVAWRGVVDAAAIADLEIPVSAYVDMGPRLSFVYYYVSGGARLNWIALDPLTNWVDGRIALLGDAAHAMLPYHAQGAVQSIEDAWVLERTLSLPDDPPAALTCYETLRRDRANQLIQQSRNAERWYHVEDPNEVTARNARFRRNNERFGDDFSPQQHWLYSYDAEAAACGTDDAWRELPAWS